MRDGDAGNRAEMPGYSSGSSGRNPQGPVAGAPSPTARREYSSPDEVQLRARWSNDRTWLLAAQSFITS